jgi:hypothetical protein
MAASLLAMPLSFSALEQYANARYHLPAVTLACGLAGIAAARLVEWADRRIPARLDRAVVAAALVLLAAIPRLDLLTRMWTPQREFEFYRAGLRRLGPGCSVVAQMEGWDAGFVPFADPDIPRPTDVEAFLAGPGLKPQACVVYYRGANCRSPDVLGLPAGTAFEENPGCREFEERATLSPIVEASLPALPFRLERYSVDPVPVGFYTVVDLRPR